MRLLSPSPEIDATPPVAQHGGPYSADLGSGVTFNGSSSFDPDAGDSIASYSWSIASGAYALAGPTPSLTQLEVDALGAGTHSVQLTVTDTFGATNSSSTTLAIYDNRPFASSTANPNPTACSQPVGFNASSSYHGRPDRSLVAYVWDFGDGATGTGVSTAHAFNQYGSYSARLTVTDNNLPPMTSIFTVIVTVNQGNQAPVASHGGPYAGDSGTGVSFNGAGSSDPNAACGDSIVSYSWNIANGTYTLTGVTPSLTSAQVNALGAGTFSVVLTATDSFGAAGTSSTTLTVSTDTTPNSFIFTSQTGVALSTSVSSNSITVSGINVPAPISITGGTYSINGGTYTSGGSVTVNNGDTVTVRVVSLGTNLSTKTATLTIGGISGSFSVTTMAANTPPAPSATITQNGWTVTVIDNSTDLETALAALGVTVDWGTGSPSPGSGGSTFTKTYSVAGTYVIKHSVTDAGGLKTWSPNVSVTVPVKYQVTGRVMMLNGTTPVSGASVRLKVGASVKKMTTTNSSGNYTFMDVLPDSYTVEAVKSGLTFSSTPAANVTTSNIAVPDIKAVR